MQSETKTKPLEGVLLRHVFTRLFLPLLALGLTILCYAAYYSDRSLKEQQQQTALSTAQLIDQYLEQSDLMLEALARLPAASPSTLNDFMSSSREAYGIFETIYYLDANNRISLLVPPDPRYQGLDMSNLPYFQQIFNDDRLAVSRPFTSLRTGEPTVYLAKVLAEGRLVGALNLGRIQQQISNLNQNDTGSQIFLLDRSGTLLAHPDQQKVKEQVNFSTLEIFKSGLRNNSTMIYQADGLLLLGSSAKTSRTGWIVINQTPLLHAWGPYLPALLIGAPLALLLWFILWHNLGSSLRRDIIAPLVSLSQNTAALASGDYQQAKALALRSYFRELDQLLLDFYNLSHTLAERQTALSKSEKRYRSLFDQVPVGLFRLTADGKVSDANPAFGELLACSKRPASSSLFFKDLHTDPKDYKFDDFTSTVGDTFEYETQLRRFDGRIIWARVKLRGIETSDASCFFDASLEDITQRKLAAAELQAAHDRLESQVEMRTQELGAVNEELNAINQELLQTLDKLQATQQDLIVSEKRAALSNLVVGVAHEVNTPLGAAITVSSHLKELLAEALKNYEQNKLSRTSFLAFITDAQEAVNLLLSSLQRAAALIKNFRQISVNQSGEKAQTFNLLHHLEAVISNLRSTNPDFSRHQIELACPDDLELNSFPSAFAHIANALLLNAHLHGFGSAEQGSIRICASLNAKELSLSFEDNGKGIAPDFKSKIFDPFFTTRRGAGSIGLDLYIVANIVTQQLAGSIECQSEVGKGTKFLLTLPV